MLMKMNTFVKFLLFCTLIQYNEVGPCDLTPKEVESLHVQVFYAFGDGRWDSTKHLIDTVCDNYKLFGNKLTVEFVLITRLIVTNEGSAIYPDYWEEELTEMCTELLSPNPIEYTCCKSYHEECADQQNILSEDITKCVEQGYISEVGTRLTDNNWKSADAGVWAGTLPALRFNNQTYDKCTDNAGYDDFVNTCCQLYKPECAPKPPC